MIILEADHLVKTYGTARALDDLCLTVEAGSLFAFLGPNGAGKTTTIRIAAGIAAPTAGTVRVAGTTVRPANTAARQLCGLVGQRNNLDSELSVRENLDFHCRLWGMPRARRLERIDMLLEYVGLADHADAQIKTLSGGMRRRVMIARSLLHEPRILFLDEPTTGLDAEIRHKTWDLIRKVRDDGVTVFLTTHYIEEAEVLADSAGIIHHGRLIAQGSPQEIAARAGTPTLEQAYLALTGKQAPA